MENAAATQGRSVDSATNVERMTAADGVADVGNDVVRRNVRA
jgi:hypothetical protein